ncbi:MAG: hypothetical protein GX359_02530 [Clostridiales bacterium]|nr:hypothetical protein [Clostridiales bacterium]
MSINCQIVMIADTIDAITSGRPYKSSKSGDAAIDIIRKDKEKYSQDLLTLLDLYLYSREK